MEDATTFDVVIVGAGHAGGACALALRKLGYRGTIALFGEEAELPYERPSLSKEYLSGKDTAPKFLAERPLWETNEIIVRTSQSVTAVDRHQKSVALAGGRSVNYRSLVLATGGRPRRLPFTPHDRLRYLRSSADSAAIAEMAKAQASAIIFGGGVIGLEVAATLRSMGLAITIVEASNRSMARSIPEEVASWLEALHEREGCRIFKGCLPTAVKCDQTGVRALFPDGEMLSAGFAVVGVGIEPNVELATASGLACADGIIVDDQYRSVTDPSMFAIGDVARSRALLKSGHGRDESWAHAQASAQAAARAIAGLPAEPERGRWFWTSQFGSILQVAGKPNDAATSIRRGAGKMLFLDHSDVLVGAAMLDSPREFAILRKLIASSAKMDARMAALETTDLRKAVVGEIKASG